MVIRLGRNGRFLACSLYPEHQEARPLPGEEPPRMEGKGDACPQCGEGQLAQRRGRFGPFLGCSRYPDCDYIKKEGPPPPAPLAFEVICPKNGDGRLLARRARRTGNVFWGCSAYPKCDYTTNFEPVGAVHDADAGAVARHGDVLLCLVCGAAIEAPAEGGLVGLCLAGGPPNPGALARPRRAAGPGGGPPPHSTVSCALSRRATHRRTRDGPMRRASASTSSGCPPGPAAAGRAPDGSRCAAIWPSWTDGGPLEPRSRPAWRRCAPSIGTLAARAGWTATRGRPSPRPADPPGRPSCCTST